MEFNPQKQLAGLLEWMDQQMKNCGGKTAVIGISGGKDSSTVAALAVLVFFTGYLLQLNISIQ